MTDNTVNLAAVIKEAKNALEDVLDLQGIVDEAETNLYDASYRCNQLERKLERLLKRFANYKTEEE